MTTTSSHYAGTNQARQPAGSPNAAGGQFAATSKAQPDVMLHDLTDEEYNADGSYYFPPSPRSATQHIAFWTSVPLPETRLRAFINAYPDVRNQIGMDAAGKAVDAYKSQHRDPTQYSNSKKALEAGERWKAEVGQVYDAAFNEAVADIPEKVYLTTVRPLVRAHQLAVFRLPLPAQDQQAVLDHQLLVDGVPMRVGDIYEKYRLAWFTNTLTDTSGPL